ncbi:ATP-binding cassette domain-containing protein [Nocardioides carbamazepini]|uniref:ABC transporter ATP-binding protein n=1 Tax=Nocardioides carbamazepini TaxID=2854259 RepID=UPI00214A6835|nr:ATP-binding cassette domain-containing protein [Nocardioides carbamazepini]MCR1783074.1 ATP-binding cassette domain-containing protein [Nocardioides carbamazepini]
MIGREGIVVDGMSKTYRVPVRDAGLSAAFRSVVRRAKRTVSAVDNVSFTISPGEVVGFIGPNGAGKTTTLKLLTGLLEPSAGTARVNGHIPWRRSPEYLGTLALIAGQRSQLQWDLPVVDSFALNKAIYRIGDGDFATRVRELTELLDLGDLMNRPSRNLSLGERMKCEFAASLLHAPQLLFLDEPTIGLDLETQRRIREFVVEFNSRQGSTVMLTSHYMADVEAMCKRVILIHQGRILFDGQLRELTSRFAAGKSVRAELGRVDADREGELRRLFAEHEYHLVGNQVQISVPAGLVAAVTNRLLTNFDVVDLTVTEPDLESVIEAAFAHSESRSNG